MKVFVAGATGVIGWQLVPLLMSAGHDVTGMARRSTTIPRRSPRGCPRSPPCSARHRPGTCPS